MQRRARLRALRPAICRAYGATAELPWPYGCRPKTPITDAAITRLVARIEQLSRHVTGVRAWPVT
ncbi:hypothetical protein [Amycolatopsis sp. cmx-4-61]|uniref:hypothetical protein n=1 Tax=Amycolatopsis sp. cmx-4-61 TaxID=2790937 RepID=UPI0039785303